MIQFLTPKINKRNHWVGQVDFEALACQPRRSLHQLATNLALGIILCSHGLPSSSASMVLQLLLPLHIFVPYDSVQLR